jgi:N utilization substance protein A
MFIDQEAKKATAIISDDQISLAIGRGGQNRQLASMLTGYEITTVKESEWELGEAKEEKLPLSDVSELSKAMIEKLTAAGYETADDILDASREELLALKGIGEKTIDKIIGILNTYYEEEPEEESEEELEEKSEQEEEEKKPKAKKKSKKESDEKPIEETKKAEAEEKSEEKSEEETTKRKTKKKTEKKSEQESKEETIKEETKEEAGDKSEQKSEGEETKAVSLDEEAGTLDSKDES